MKCMLRNSLLMMTYFLSVSGFGAIYMSEGSVPPMNEAIPAYSAEQDMTTTITATTAADISSTQVPRSLEDSAYQPDISNSDQSCAGNDTTGKKPTKPTKCPPIPAGLIVAPVSTTK
jgi:hypothetical protein